MGAVGGAWPGSVRASGPRRQATSGSAPGQVATGSVPCHHVIRLDAATVLLHQGVFKASYADYPA